MRLQFLTTKTRRLFNKVLPGSSAPFSFIIILSLPLTPNSKLFSQLELNGQATALLSMSGSSTVNTLRYIPEFDYMNHSFNLNFAPNFTITNAESAPDILQPYRAWLRYITTYWEWKAGLQKINFGPGKVLRSLQWFDQLDPRDPTNQTTGVWGVKSRYTSMNNRSIWAWMLMGNDELKGMEITNSNPEIPELGGRFEQPVGLGEIGITSHLRALKNASKDSMPMELRVGFDGYFEYGLGMWFENSSSVILNSPLQPESMVFNTFGVDYTFGIGNGLYITGEWLSTMSKINNDMHFNNIFAIMSSYPVSWLDNISTFITFYPKSDFTMVYFSWQRTLDNWIILISGYKTTDIASDLSFLGAQTLPGSSGVQFMLTFNH